MLLLGPLVSLLLLVGVSSGPAPQDGHAPLEVPQQEVNDPVLSRGKRDVLDDLKRGGTSSCTIKNDYYDEFMYAGSWFHKDELGRRVYTWTEGPIEGGSQWQVVTSGNYFYLRNPHYYGEYLIGKDDCIRTIPLEYKGDKRWKIEIISGNKVRISLTSTQYLGAYDSFSGIYRRTLGLESLSYWEDKRITGIDKYPDVWELNC